MRGLHKSKRVSWASEFNLCQVRLFLTEESPSQVGSGAQDHLQAKASWLLHSNGTASDDILPPGFEETHSGNNFQIKLSDIPIKQWSRPLRFVLDTTWQVVAGEESIEVEGQNQRELRVLEAVYPRPSAIPPNPSLPVEMRDPELDGQPPTIPITPIEDEDVTTDGWTDSASSYNVSTNSKPSLFASPVIPSPPQCPPANMAFPLAEPDVVSAASLALGAVMKRNDQGNLIDQDLLIKILSNPKMIENLVSNVETVNNSQTKQMPMPSQMSLSDLPQFQIENSSPSPAALSTRPFFPQPNSGPAGSVTAPLQAKDMSYYKSLIQQHGAEKQEISPFVNRQNHQSGANQEMINNQNSRDPKPKRMKPCIYFNSSRGCRHGANCSYQHDSTLLQRSSSGPDVQSAKRMKVERDISS